MIWELQNEKQSETRHYPNLSLDLTAGNPSGQNLTCCTIYRWTDIIMSENRHKQMIAVFE